MNVFIYIGSLFLPYLLLASALRAEPGVAIKPVAHTDPIEVDTSLSLAKTVDLTMEKFPDISWLKSLEDEADAIKKRGESWTAGASQAGLRYQSTTSTTVHYGDVSVQVPLWNLGQRDAERKYGLKAQASAEFQSQAVRLRIAGLVRAALWDMELQTVRLEQAQNEVDIFDKLLAKVERRVELGDLPRADALLAQSELLQKLSILTQAEAEVMHSRKRYANITQMTRAPGNYREKLANLKKIELTHPAFVAVNSQIERKQAEMQAFKLIGSGQTNIVLGVNSDRTQNNDPRSNKTESFNIAVNIPFGGEQHLQPQVAALNVEMNRLIAEREQLFRDLELAHHEAEHNLEVNQAQLEIANELKRTAEEHARMTEIGFSAGEITLIDLLKVKNRAQQAILNAKERAIILERDIALYNQAVGVSP